jgi:hypothetical protein
MPKLKVRFEIDWSGGDMAKARLLNELQRLYPDAVNMQVQTEDKSDHPIDTSILAVTKHLTKLPTEPFSKVKKSVEEFDRLWCLYIEMMASAYLAETDIPATDVELVCEHGSGLDDFVMRARFRRLEKEKV